MPESRISEPGPDDQGPEIKLRLQAGDIAALDAWIRRQDPQPTRPDAIRLLVEAALRFSNPAIGLKEAEEFISDLRRRARYPQPPDAPMFRAARKLKAEYLAAHPEASGAARGKRGGSEAGS